MHTNRIQHLFPAEVPASTPAVPQGFVPFPFALLPGLTPIQHSVIATVYRIAHERAQTQVRPAVPSWESRIQFSLN